MTDTILYQVFEGAVVVFETFTVYVFLSGCFPKKDFGSAVQILVFAVFCLALGGASIFYPNMMLLPIITIAGVIGLAAVLYEGHVLSYIFAALFYLAIGIGIEFIVPMLHSLLIGEELAVIHSPGFWRILSTVTAKVLNLAVIKFATVLFHRHKGSLSRRMRETVPLILSQFIMLVIMTSSFINSYHKYGVVTGIIMLEVFGVLFISMVILWYYDILVSSYEMRHRAEIEIMQQESQVKYFDMIKTHQDKINAVEHDIRKHFMAVESMTRTGHMQEVSDYVNSLADVIGENMEIVLTPHPVVSSLLSYCKQKAHEINVECIFDISVSELIGINQVDLTIIMGNTIDNALEANAVLDDGRQRYIKIKFIQSKHFLFYEISNPFDAHRAKQNAENRARRGYGLSNAEASVTKYGGEFIKETKEGEFTVTITLPCRAKEEPPAL